MLRRVFCERSLLQKKLFCGKIKDRIYIKFKQAFIVVS